MEDGVIRFHLGASRSVGPMARSLFWAQEKRVRFPYVPRISTTAATTSPFPRTFILLLWLVPAPLSYGGWSGSIPLGSFRDCGPTARHHVRIMVTRVRLPSIPWGGCIHSSPASCAEASHAQPFVWSIGYDDTSQKRIKSGSIPETKASAIRHSICALEWWGV